MVQRENICNYEKKLATTYFGKISHSKRPKTSTERTSHEAQEQVYAGLMLLRDKNSGKTKAVKDIMNSPTTSDKYKNCTYRNNEHLKMINLHQQKLLFVKTSLSTIYIRLFENLPTIVVLITEFC